MAYYEPQGWQAPMRQTSWEQPPPPSRSGASSATQREEPSAFASQFDEVDRAVDNLVKSGKIFSGASRRESLPLSMGRQFDYGDPRMGGAGPPGPHPQRHHSISDYDAIRPHSASNMQQGFYASQRHPGRTNEAEQMIQAKRRMAAQRERELRNYHQEQQYNRSLLAEIPGNKSDRSMSPTMNEENRRDLIARQHRALYGNETSPFVPSGGISDDGQRSESQSAAAGGTPVTAASGGRGPSPRGMDPFGLGSSQPNVDNSGASTQVPTSSGPGQPSAMTQQPQSPTNGSSPPGPGANAGRTNVDSSSQGSTKAPGAPVGPIGSRPPQQPTSTQAANNPALNKSSNTPLPSPLSYGFSPNEVNNPNGGDTSASQPNPAATQANTTPSSGADSSPSVGLGWGGGNTVWRSKNSLGAQASVWG